MSRTGELVTTGRAGIETYVDGEGPAVVVLPSYGRDGGADFDHFTAALTGAGYRVLRPQPRGIARSSGPMTGVTLADLGDDIAHVIQDLGNGRAAVLGHAFGSVVARAVATDHPDTVAAVILAAASAPAIPPEITAAPFRAADPGLPDDERLAALELAFFASGHDPSAWLTGWYPRTLRMQREAAAAGGSGGGGPTGIQVGRCWAAGVAPILEIIPASDPFLPKDRWGDLRSRFGSRVTTRIIDDAGHALFPEQPDAVASAVADYLGPLMTSAPRQEPSPSLR